MRSSCEARCAWQLRALHLAAFSTTRARARRRPQRRRARPGERGRGARLHRVAGRVGRRRRARRPQRARAGAAGARAGGRRRRVRAARGAAGAAPRGRVGRAGGGRARRRPGRARRRVPGSARALLHARLGRAAAGARAGAGRSSLCLFTRTRRIGWLAHARARAHALLPPRCAAPRRPAARSVHEGVLLFGQGSMHSPGTAPSSAPHLRQSQVLSLQADCQLPSTSKSGGCFRPASVTRAWLPGAAWRKLHRDRASDARRAAS